MLDEIVHGPLPHRIVRQSYRRERLSEVRSDDFLIVEPHDCNIFRDRQAELGQCLVSAHRDPVSSTEDGRWRVRNPHQFMRVAIATRGGTVTVANKGHVKCDAGLH